MNQAATKILRKNARFTTRLNEDPRRIRRFLRNVCKMLIVGGGTYTYGDCYKCTSHRLVTRAIRLQRAKM